MSAYDNPTIIKDDSAMVWAQATSGFAESFKQSFDAARKEKEAKMKADKEQSIKDQMLISEFEYKEQANAQEGAGNLQKLGATPDALSIRNDFRINTSKVVGKNALEISKNVLSKEALAEKNKYASDVSAVTSALDNGMGTTFSQSSDFRDGKVNIGNISNIVFNGDDLLNQGINKAVFFAFTYPKASNATKGLDYDINKPADAKLDVRIPLNNLEELKKIFKAANATASPEEIDAAIKSGIENKSIIAKGDEGKEEYTIKYSPKVSEWSGEFYTKIPEIGLGETSTTVGIYSKDTDNKINNEYLETTDLEDIEGNLGLPSSAGTAKYQRTKVNVAKIKESMRSALQAKATGLITTYFNDIPSANGILRKLGFGTDYPLKKFQEAHQNDGMAGMVNDLANRMFDEEWKNIAIKSDLKEIEGKYYVMDAESYAMFNKPSKTKTKTPRVNSQETWAEREAAIKGASNLAGAHRWGSNKIYTDGAGNWYFNNEAGEQYPSMEDALKYLKTGKK